MQISNSRQPFTASFTHLSDQPFTKESKYPLRVPPIEFHEQNIYHLERVLVLQYFQTSRNLDLEAFGVGIFFIKNKNKIKALQRNTISFDINVPVRRTFVRHLRFRNHLEKHI